MKKQAQHKAATAKKQPRANISSAKDKEEKHDHEHAENEAGHEYEHGGIFGKNTELIFAALSGAFINYKTPKRGKCSMSTQTRHPQESIFI